MEARLRLTSGGVLVLTAALAFWPARARACSCIAPEEQFVLPSGAVLPRNTGGFPWWGEVSQRDKDDRVVDALPPRALFKIQELSPAGPKNVDFDLQFAPETFADHTLQPWGRRLVILKPRAALKAGAKYRLSFRLRKFSRHGEPALTDRYQVIEVSISNQALPAASAASLILEPRVIAPLEVRVGARCSARISAAQLRLSFGLPTSAQQWREGLLYDVTLDGKTQWRAAASNCADVPYGTSWVGPGRDLLFVNCSGEPVPDSLSPGGYLVTMRAWLPGTDIFLTAKRRVSLACR